MKTQNSGFRLDINGLRAVAVLAVIIFHFNPSWVPGGFAGVDVFFVISGYLMTAIIFKGIGSGSFDVFKFYAARFKRIVPALIVTSLLVIALGYLLIDPLSYQMMAQHVEASLLFISNVIYRNEAGYFDVDSSKKFFLHTWSLSVEWQFYIIYPLLVMVAKKLMSERLIKVLVVFSTIILFSLNVYVTKTDPTSSYYMLYSRAWEMLVGGLAFLYPLGNRINDTHRSYISVACLVGLLISLFALDKNAPWPGSFALAPVLFTYGVILSGGSNRLLSNRFMQSVGLISYSIYLVHWPILVFNTSLNLGINFLIYIAATTLTASGMYFFIESRRRGVIFIALFYIVAMAIAYRVSIAGITSRVNTEFQITKQQFRNKYEGHAAVSTSDKPNYFNASDNDFDYILIGDSHARHYFEYIKNNEKVISFAFDGCKSTKNYYPYSPSPVGMKWCKDRYQQQVDFINSHPGKPVILSQSGFGLSAATLSRADDQQIGGNHDFDAMGLHELSLLINAIKSTNHRIFIIGDTPGSKTVMFECLAKDNLPINRVFNVTSCPVTQEYTERKYNNLLKANAGSLGFTFIDPSPALCSSKECIVVKDGVPIYTDNSHLSKVGSVIVGGYIFKLIKNSLIN